MAPEVNTDGVRPPDAASLAVLWVYPSITGCGQMRMPLGKGMTTTGCVLGAFLLCSREVVVFKGVHPGALAKHHPSTRGPRSARKCLAIGSGFRAGLGWGISMLVVGA